MSPLLETSIDGARGVIMNITGGSNLSLYEVNEAAEIVISASDPDVNMIFGAIIDEELKDEIKVTVIATGFEHKSSIAVRRSPQQETAPESPRPSSGQTSQVKPFGAGHTSSDQLEIPAFLRNRPRGDR
jgi:cell division protein FtsZ